MRIYLIYDDRAAGGDTDSALVLTTARSEVDARHERRLFGYGVIYCYDIINHKLVNERLVDL